MSADNRGVSTDALETLGTIITENEKRDAIHLAVLPVVAGQELAPGQDVGIDSDGTAWHTKGVDVYIGIVDPFLKAWVKKGEHFWLVIYPRQITSLRHAWSHPDVPDDFQIGQWTRLVAGFTGPEKTASEKWLREFVAGLDRLGSDTPDYEQIIGSAVEDPEQMFFGATIYGAIPPEFWDHVEAVTGKHIPKKGRAEHFSCAC